MKKLILSIILLLVIATSDSATFPLTYGWDYLPANNLKTFTQKFGPYAQTNNITGITNSMVVKVGTNYWLYQTQYVYTVGFNLFQGTSSRSYTNCVILGNTNLGTITDLQSGQGVTNYVAVTSIGSNSVTGVMEQSDYSTEIKYPVEKADFLYLMRSTIYQDVTYVGWMPITNRDYTLQTSTDLLTWTNTYPYGIVNKKWITQNVTNSSPVLFFRLKII